MMSTGEVVTLKEYIESRLSSIHEATTKAYDSMNRRLEGMNEFRASLRDQAAQMVTTKELNAFRDKVEADIRSLRESRATLEGKASVISVYISYALAVGSILFSILWK